MIIFRFIIYQHLFQLFNNSNIVNWKLEETVASDCNIPCDKAGKVIKLINDGSTIPFIARYRKEYTGNLPSTTLLKIKEKFEECKTVIEEVEKSMKTIEKCGQLTENVEQALKNCKTIDDVAFVTEPFKPKSQKSLSNRARQTGLEPLALKILYEQNYFNLEDYVPQTAFTEFGDLQSIENAIRNLIADIFAKDIALLDEIEKLNCYKTTILSSTLKKAYVKPDPKVRLSEDLKENIKKLLPYHDFRRSINHLLAHQVMAINRGEKLKILKVSIIFPAPLKSVFIDLCTKKHLSRISDRFQAFVSNCALDAYERLVLPHLIRKIRNQLTKKAQSTSLDVFESNLRQLVMSSPLRGVSILGVDPGYYNGCKIVIINKKSQLLDTAVIYLSKGPQAYLEAGVKFTELVLKHSVEYIAIGDGKGNDMVIKFVSELTATNAFGNLNVRFTIVRECGASVYSITPEAEAEFPNISDTLRSSVSIARRLQDPLAEYVKMDPKNLGVGMYQHDLPTKSLVDKVNAVLDDCISFVGIDINHAPLHILVHVSGLGRVRATEIISYRDKYGPFKNRTQLLNVKGIGEKVFIQCAGFIRIKHSESESVKKFEYELDGDAKMIDLTTKPNRKKKFVDNDINYLDQTSIHPESYEIATRIIQIFNLDTSDVGTISMQHAAKSFMSNSEYLNVLSSFQTETCGIETLKDILLSLSRPLEFDERYNFNSSMLRRCCGRSCDLKLQQRVDGSVNNVTTFGLFIDIGVEQIAFSHKVPHGIVLGDVVECIITQLKSDKLGVEVLRKKPRF